MSVHSSAPNPCSAWPLPQRPTQGIELTWTPHGHVEQRVDAALIEPRFPCLDRPQSRAYGTGDFKPMIACQRHAASAFPFSCRFFVAIQIHRT